MKFFLFIYFARRNEKFLNKNLDNEFIATGSRNRWVGHIPKKETLPLAKKDALFLGNAHFLATSSIVYTTSKIKNVLCSTCLRDYGNYNFIFINSFGSR